ncbi:hypothetical protein ACFWAY_49440 [Rhodococcus sp. NPDC059968]|uniref:hypothetical protein n=1 Tax=Rhodococcus sp. NPDC059968 TaxID=3347017 RepID=UPI00366EFD5A
MNDPHLIELEFTVRVRVRLPKDVYVDAVAENPDAWENAVVNELQREIVGGEAKANFEKVTATVSDIAIEPEDFQLTVD